MYRRVFLAGLTAVTLAGCGLTGGNSGSGDGKVQLVFSWWGNNDRAAATQKVIEAFQAENPGITVKGETADFNAYFDRIATEVAAGSGPDVMTMGGAYPAEYGARGALLDLSKVGAQLKTDQIDQAALSNGNVNNTQYGVPSGVNTPVVVADPVVFQKAGVALPDDSTWTWDDFVRLAKQIAAKSPKGTYGVADPTKTDALDVYSRQRGEGLYTLDGKVGISQQTLIEWWTMTSDLRASGAAPPASLTSELMTQPAPEQSLVGRGLAGMQVDWSNQLAALRKASGHPLKLLRYPGESTAKPGMWLQASQLYTINAKTKHANPAAKFVNFLVNSENAGKIILTDRGIPANSQVRTAIQTGLAEDQSAQVEFIQRVSAQVGPPLVIGPTGSTDTPDILNRLNAEVLFNRQSPAKAAGEFIKQVSAAITK